MSTYIDWRPAYDDLRDVLVAEQEKRNQRRGFIGHEPEWVQVERLAMLDRVNLLRSRRGYGPVSLDDVTAKENQACGHSDYTTKYAIGCADLVVEPRPDETTPTPAAPSRRAEVNGAGE